LGGYIKLNRAILTHWVFKDREALQIWIYCLANASYTETQVKVKSKIVTLYPGQLLFGRKQWGSILGIDEYKVYRTIQLFVEAGMVEMWSNKQYSRLSICNWAVYQGEKFAHQHAQKPTQGNAQIECADNEGLSGIDAQENAQHLHNTCTHNKKVKNEKKKDILSSKVFADGSPIFILSLKLKESMLRNNPGAKVPDDMQGWCIEIDRMIRIDKRDTLNIEKVIEFSQGDTFWKSNILSAKKLREKFDTLFIQMKSRQDPKVKQFKAQNATNFEQRKYSDEFYESLYRNK
jgi:hypothetical protein